MTGDAHGWHPPPIPFSGWWGERKPLFDNETKRHHDEKEKGIHFGFVWTREREESHEENNKKSNYNFSGFCLRLEWNDEILFHAAQTQQEVQERSFKSLWNGYRRRMSESTATCITNVFLNRKLKSFSLASLNSFSVSTASKMIISWLLSSNWLSAQVCYYYSVVPTELRNQRLKRFLTYFTYIQIQLIESFTSWVR